MLQILKSSSLLQKAHKIFFDNFWWNPVLCLSSSSCRTLCSVCAAILAKSGRSIWRKEGSLVSLVVFWVEMLLVRNIFLVALWTDILVWTGQKITLVWISLHKERCFCMATSFKKKASLLKAFNTQSLQHWEQGNLSELCCLAKKATSHKGSRH